MERKDSKEIQKCYKVEIKIHSNKITFLNCIIVYYFLSVFYNISQSVQCLWNTVVDFFSGKVCCWWL